MGERIADGLAASWQPHHVGQAGVEPGFAIQHRQDGSGTTSILANFLTAAASKSDWPLKLDTVDKTVNWKGGQGATGSDGVTQGVKQTEGGLTYAEVSYAKQDSLPTAAIKGFGSDYVNISSDTVAQSIQSEIGRAHV